ncbi:ATP-dependent DNA helicase participating in chromosome replication [gamma proteobacterium HdN1]|nr:ATP-dependent DNA helicase participating in chromosome replication [gamma proteobacterium HdN1]
MKDLNPRQQEAVRYIDGPLLVLAGAGSGKTSVITRKIAHLVQKCGIPANRIVAVTFTNKASREMKERVGHLISGAEARGLTVSTFHNLGLNILRKEHKSVGLKNGFSIFDDQDSRSLLTELSHKETAVAGEDVDYLRNKISQWKNDLVTPSQAQSHAAGEEEMRAAHVYSAYDRCLRAYNAVDFDDLISLPTLLFRDNEEVRERWQHKIHYLLVDEYQDTNTSQYLLVRLLVGRRARFTVVGDDDQSIYAWRGARPENLVQLAEDYPALKVVKLEQNYRSTQRILKAANAVIDNNPHVFTKQLWSEHGFGEQIRIIRCLNEESEADRVAMEIMHQKMQKGRDFKDFAVLYRGNFQSRTLEIKLQAYQIPYKVSGGTSFFSRSEIKDVMAYLRLVINPDDDNAFLRIINTPRREIGPSTLEKLAGYAQQRGVGLFAACDEMGLEQTLTGRPLQNLQRFSRWLAETTERIQRTDAIPAIQQMLRDIDYQAWLLEQAPSAKAAEKRMENVNQLVESMERMLGKQEEEDIAAVIGKLILIDLLEQRDEEDASDKVQLMTLHASKGLEWPYVFIMGLEEELLPHRNAIEEDTIEEERRLMYVGITRAQRELTLSLTAKRKQYGEEFEPAPSRFLDELPTDDVVWEGKGGEQRSVEQKKALGRAYMANIRSLLE